VERRFRTWVALVVFAAVLLALPLLVRQPYYRTILVFVGINALAATGLNLLMGYAGQVSLGHAAFVGIGGYASAVLSVNLGVNPWAAMVAGVVAASLIAWLIGIPTLRLHGHYLAIATLGFGMIVSIVFAEWRGLTGGVGGIPGVPALRVAGLALDNHLRFYYLVWTCLYATVIATSNISNSRLGRALRAIRGSEIAAQTTGINTGSYKLQVFVLSAALAALAGSLFVHYISFASPSRFGFAYSIELVVMAVLGGLGNMWGPIVGSGVVTALGELLRPLRDLDVPAFGLILVLVLIFLPRGVTTSLGLLVQRLRAPRPTNGEVAPANIVGAGEP